MGTPLNVFPSQTYIKVNNQQLHDSIQAWYQKYPKICPPSHFQVPNQILYQVRVQHYLFCDKVFANQFPNLFESIMINNQSKLSFDLWFKTLYPYYKDAFIFGAIVSEYFYFYFYLSSIKFT